MESHTNSAANKPDSLAEYLGNTVAAQVNSQLCATNSRVDKLEDDIARLGDDLTTRLSAITTQLQGLASQLSQSRETNSRTETTLRDMTLQMETRFREMDSRMETRFRKTDSRMDERFNRVDNELRKMATDNNAKFTGINNQFTGLTTHLNSQITDVHESLGKNKTRMEALHRNAMSRLDNRLPGASNDNLEPLFNLDTGEKIQNTPTRAGFGHMTTAAIENCLRGLEITPEGLKNEKLNQLKNAYGVQSGVYFQYTGNAGS